MEKSSYQKKESKALREVISENMASMPKGFDAIDPGKPGSDIGPMPYINYPTFHMSLKDIPEAKKWQVGERYTLEVVVEMTGMSDRIGQKPNVDFSIIGVKAGEHVDTPASAKKAEKAVEDQDDSEDDE